MTTGRENLPTAKALIARGTRTLQAELSLSGGEAARLSGVLFMALSGLSKAQLIGGENEFVSDRTEHDFLAGVTRCSAGESVYRVIGQRPFYGLDLSLNQATLEPRPDTECLVDLALKYADGRFDDVVSFADLGTGSGAIALAILQNLQDANATLVDVSDEALGMAEQNAKTHGLAERCRFIQSSWFEKLDGEFSFIVSNPPYIRSDVIAGLAPNVRNFDPSLALDGGTDGLGAYRIILSDAGSYLRHNGFLALEIGFDQAGDVLQLARQKGWDLLELAQDTGGHDRAVIFSR